MILCYDILVLAVEFTYLYIKRLFMFKVK